MPEVLNKSWNKIPKESVYIGRPSKWGNPFSHKVGTLAKYKVSSREDAVQKHKEWLDAFLAKDEDVAYIKGYRDSLRDIYSALYSSINLKYNQALAEDK